MHIRPLKLCLARRSVRTCQFRNSGETEQGWVRDQSPGFPGGLEPRFSRLGSHEPVARAVNTDLYTVQSSREGKALPRAGSCLIFIERGIRVSRRTERPRARLPWDRTAKADAGQRGRPCCLQRREPCFNRLRSADDCGARHAQSVCLPDSRR